MLEIEHRRHKLQTKSRLQSSAFLKELKKEQALSLQSSGLVGQRLLFFCSSMRRYRFWLRKAYIGNLSLQFEKSKFSITSPSLTGWNHNSTSCSKTRSSPDTGLRIPLSFHPFRLTQDHPTQSQHHGPISRSHAKIHHLSPKRQCPRRQRRKAKGRQHTFQMSDFSSQMFLLSAVGESFDDVVNSLR